VEVELIYLEDLRDSVTQNDKLRALLTHKLPLARRLPTDTAAILFTRAPKARPRRRALAQKYADQRRSGGGAHRLRARRQSIQRAADLSLFGLTVGFVLPLVSGVPIYLYPSPLHYRIVPELVYASNATILFGTDTFLAGYARSANAYDFRSIRYVVAGAEPVRKERARFGARNSACAFWKDMASRRPRRCWR